MPHPFRFGVTLTGTDVDELATAARRAEELGYATVSIADHLDDQPAPLLGLLAAADATRTIRVQTLVLANDYRHPAVLAKELTTLDRLSGGRLEIGIGAGWKRADYDRAGIVYDSPGVRIDRLAETIAVLDDLLAGRECTFHGTHYRIDGLVGRPLPHQRPRPPLLVAGGGRRILGLAGRTADIVGLNPGLAAGVIDHRAGSTATPDATDQKLAWVRDAADDRLAAIEIQTRVHLAAITDDRVGLAEALAPALGLTLDEALHSPHALVGTVAECVDTIRAWRDRWGISYIGINGDAMETMAPVVERLAGT